jgi:hypothetical protein
VALAACALQVEPVGEPAVNVFYPCIRAESHAAVGAAGGRRHKRTRVFRLGNATGVLVEHGEGIVVPAVLMSSADFGAQRCAAEGELVEYVLLRPQGVHGSDIGFFVDIVRTQIHAARLGDGQVQLKLAHSEAQRIFGELHQPADVHKFQVGVPQSSGRVVARDANIVIYPEGDAVAEIARCKEAE